MDADGCWKNLSSCSNGLTICLWLNVVSTSSTNWIFSSAADSANQHGAYLYATSPNLIPRLRTPTHDHMYPQGGIPYSNNDWIHFCLTWNPAPQELKVYVMMGLML